MALTPRQLVERSQGLISLPEVFLRINSMINDGRSSLQAIGDVVALDAALSARLLKVVNSPFYGHPSRIDTISRAISIVGLNDFYHLLLGSCAADVFKRIPHDLVNMSDMWAHSVYCAVIARQLARVNAVLHVERFFVAGLLHQIGNLLIYNAMPDEARELLLQVDGRFWLTAPLEQARWNYTYADVGAELARGWNLPESLCATIGGHLQPENSEEFRFDATLLHLAYLLKNHLFQQETGMADLIPELLAKARGVVALDEQRLLLVLTTVPELAEQALGMIAPA